MGEYTIILEGRFLGIFRALIKELSMEFFKGLFKNLSKPQAQGLFQEFYLVSWMSFNFYLEDFKRWLAYFI